ncbi:hypothetical protein GA0115259_103616 [Streptomyces sp. MnatMP-M17]|nr:hypothetical protein GA0115259_103616 [Streptomyces sp. MnatMP-M17]
MGAPMLHPEIMKRHLRKKVQVSSQRVAVSKVPSPRSWGAPMPRPYTPSTLGWLRF